MHFERGESLDGFEADVGIREEDVNVVPSEVLLTAASADDESSRALLIERVVRTRSRIALLEVTCVYREVSGKKLEDEYLHREVACPIKERW